MADVPAPASLTDLSGPVLLVDERICRANIRRMSEKCRAAGIRLRPHFKTHQSRLAGSWYREAGCRAITVSSMDMARFFAADGWNDITVAFPWYPAWYRPARELARQCSLNLLVSDPVAARELALSSLREPASLGVFIELDTGHDRSGLAWNDWSGQSLAIGQISRAPSLRFSGFLTHSGHSYGLPTAALPDFQAGVVDRLRQVRARWQSDFPELLISCGDTPTAVACSRFDGIDELRPGNYLYFDQQQASRGVCSPADIGMALACPVAARYPEGLKVILHAGAVHLSKDSYTDSAGRQSYGAIGLLNRDLSWSAPLPGLWLSSLSQEHGTVRADNPEAFAPLLAADWVAVLPAHSCLAAASIRRTLVIGEENRWDQLLH